MRLDAADDGLLEAGMQLAPGDAALIRALATAAVDGKARLSAIRRQLVREEVGFSSRQQVIRRINALVEKGVLRRGGGGPQTHYLLNERAIARAWLQSDRLKRSDKAYQASVIHDYVPNRMRLLPPEYSSDLLAVSEAAIRPGATLNEVVFRRYMLDFSWASSRMEGNTYTFLETAALLEDGREATGKTHAEATMLRNHAEAIGYILRYARELDLSPAEFRGIHALLARGLLADSGQVGAVRHSIVEIGRSVYRPSALPQVLEAGLAHIAEKARAIADPFEQSFFLLATVSYLQPFLDVNKRTARVLANVPLLKAGLCPLSFYGMDEQAYIDGLLAYYEIQSSALLADAYARGYRASAERFRSYASALGERVAQTEADREQRRQVDATVKSAIRAVADRRVEQSEVEDFIRRNLATVENPGERDAIIVAALRLIRKMDLADAVAMGIAPVLFRRYQRTVKHASELRRI
jgi:Fic family protein